MQYVSYPLRSALCFLVLFSLVACTPLRVMLGENEQVDLSYPLWHYAQMTEPATLPDTPTYAPTLNRTPDGKRLYVNGLDFPQGISVRGNALIAYELDEHAHWLQMLVGIDDSTDDRHAEARVTVRGNGFPLATLTPRARRDPQKAEIPLDNVSRLVIHIEAPTNVITSLLVPRIIGRPGLTVKLRDRRETYRDYYSQKPLQLPRPVSALNNAVLMPGEPHGYPGCLIMINAHAAMVIDPYSAGEILFFGTSLASPAPLHTAQILGLHPEERRFDRTINTLPLVWKWHWEKDGTLRLLSAPDPVYGVRYGRNYYLFPDTPVMRTTAFLQNNASYDISWSLGNSTHLPYSATILLPKEETPPGYSLVNLPATGIEVENELVLISPYDAWHTHSTQEIDDMQIVASREDIWWMAFMPRTPVLGVFPDLPSNARYFPYVSGATRVRTTPESAHVETFSEITRLAPNEYCALSTYWICVPPYDSAHEAAEALLQTREKAKRIHQEPEGPGTPTGRVR